ncbi:MAG: glutathione S-transferase family protein [Geminicoccaceae bacterium]
MSGYILFGGGPTRSMMTEMVFAEGKIAYELREIDIFKRAHRTPEFLAINPFGWVPALVAPDGETISETPAINLWLCERHELDLAPPPGNPARGAFLTAFHNVVGEIEPTMKRVFFAHRYALAKDQIEAARNHAKKMLLDRIEPLERRLASSGLYFLGERFSLADLTFLYWMAYVEDWGDLDGFPATKKALDLARARPALADIFARQADWIVRLKQQ